MRSDFISLFGALMFAPLLLASDLNQGELSAEELAAQANHSSPQGKLVIIIDDLGNSLRSGLDAIALPGHITFAVMPHRKHSKLLAQRAGILGKDVLLHAPMSTVNNRALGPGALRQELGEKAFKDRLRYAIGNTPFIKGINNHMGSQLTTQPQAMVWVMEVLKEKQLFFVDSRTHAQSLAYKTAIKMGLKSAKRDIFLDHVIELDAIHEQFKKALRIAQKYGSAIAIGHPHPATLSYLDHVIPQLASHQIQLAPISELVSKQVQAKSIPPQPSDSDLDRLIDSLTLSPQHTSP